jgi:hypothetical protein
MINKRYYQKLLMDIIIIHIIKNIINNLLTYNFYLRGVKLFDLFMYPKYIIIAVSIQ